MKDKIRLAMVGCGGMAGAHLNSYITLKERNLDQFDFVAMCDVVEANARNFAEKASKSQDGRMPGVYTELDEMLEKENIDAADICSPHYLHHSMSISCFEAGADVIVEKPLGVTVRAGKKMIEAAERNNQILAVAEQVRRWVGPRTVEWMINTEEMVGTPRMFFCKSIRGPSDPEQKLRQARLRWRHNKLKSGGNGLIDGGVHYADLLLYLFGEVEEVYAKVENLNQFKFLDGNEDFVPVTVEDTVVATLTFRNGVIGTWIISGAAPGQGSSYNTYHGSSGSIHGGNGGYPRNPKLHLADGEVKEKDELTAMYMESLNEKEKDKLFPHGITEGVTLEVYDFIDAVVNRRRPELDGTDGLNAQTICEAIYESAWRGESVKVEDVYDEKIADYQKEINEHWKI